MKYKINEVVEAVEEQNKYILQNRNNMSVVSQNMLETKKEHRHVLSKIQEHNIKLSVSNDLPRKTWILTFDTEKYPILATYQNTVITRFTLLLNQIGLQGDKIVDIKQFCKT